MRLLLVFIAVLFSLQIYSQEILRLNDQEAGKAKISDMDFIRGHWKGQMGSQSFEEIWTAPAAGQMMGMFRLYSEKVNVYEFMSIAETDQSLVLRIKHFNEEMLGWEEKDDYEEFRLVKIEKNTAYFDKITFQLEKDILRIKVIVDEKEDEVETALFEYRKMEE